MVDPRTSISGDGRAKASENYHDSTATASTIVDDIIERSAKTP